MRREVGLMADRNGNERIVNVKVCHRIGGERSILVCASCYNEVEGNVSTFFTNVGEFDAGSVPRYNFCPWCSTPLREEP